MPVIQLAEISGEGNQAAWGETLVTAEVVLGYMVEHALGLVHAKTAEQITVGAATWANLRFAGDFKKEVPGVLHRLVQGVACAALRMEGCEMHFYVHTDYCQRLHEERKEADAAHFQAMVPKSLPKPCVTRGCPYAGTWEPSMSGAGGGRSEAVFPDGPKCCGSCTGVHPRGRSMAVAHGVHCERVPWLGVPVIDTKTSTWLAITSPATLNEVVQKASGTARLVDKELQARVAGVSIEWTVRIEHKAGAAVNICQLTVTKSEGQGHWRVQMAGPTHAMAKLRATMAFLYCYARLLEVAREGKPADYGDVWVDSFMELTHAEEPCQKDEAPHDAVQGVAMALELASEREHPDWDPEFDDSSEGSSDSAGAAAAAAAEVVAVKATPPPLGPGGLNQFSPRTPLVKAPPPTPGAALIGAASVPDIWGDGTIVAAPGLLVATRAMCAVARYETKVYALPKQQTHPGTKIVPVNELRNVLGQDPRTRHMSLGVYTDDQLLNAFVAEARLADAQKHGNVWRFGRALLDPSTMCPADQSSRSSLQNRDEPCLVVRMKRGG